ncbi:hypothetical protein [Alkalicoccus urumqiensis]|uniref:hypothetical protein n=1 Tax=Alkalicoccus urumqiensis TaxID=1548213 RepID=UPI0015E6254B|nr:hypothetical protein [Alkalicoccus urumqiensis]
MVRYTALGPVKADVVPIRSHRGPQPARAGPIAHRPVAHFSEPSTLSAAETARAETQATEKVSIKETLYMESFFFITQSDLRKETLTFSISEIRLHYRRKLAAGMASAYSNILWMFCGVFTSCFSRRPPRLSFRLIEPGIKSMKVVKRVP